MGKLTCADHSIPFTIDRDRSTESVTYHLRGVCNHIRGSSSHHTVYHFGSGHAIPIGDLRPIHHSQRTIYRPEGRRAKRSLVLRMVT